MMLYQEQKYTHIVTNISCNYFQEQKYTGENKNIREQDIKQFDITQKQ